MSLPLVHNEFIDPSQMIRLDILAHRELTDEEILRIANRYRQTRSWQRHCQGLGERQAACRWLTVTLKSPVGIDRSFGTTTKMRPLGLPGGKPDEPEIAH